MNVMAPTPNAPISIDELEVGLAKQLEQLAGTVGETLSLEPLGRQKAVADSTTKALVRTLSGRPVAVVLCSRPVSPDLAERGHRYAEAVREIIGEELGQVVVRSLAHGYVDGRSYVILPCCREFSSFKIVRIAQRKRLQGRVLWWLLAANRAAAERNHDRPGAAEAFREMLQHLDQTGLIAGGPQEALSEAMDRLGSGAWAPRHTVDHNDLWLGNVMLPPRNNPLFRAKAEFVLIDWVGANPLGFGIYDLARLALTLKLPVPAVRRHLVAHAGALGCELGDTRGHLLAALGRLHVNLEHFPEQRYLRTFGACWNLVEAASRQ